MDNNNKNNQNNNKNKKNVNGLLILVIWAVGLTVVFNYLSAYSRQANSAASTHEIQYSEFKRLVKEGLVESVVLTDGKIEITTEDGYVYVDENGNRYDKNFTLFTMQMGIYDPDLLDTLESGPDFLDAFDRDLFGELVERVIVESSERVRFRLKNGLELAETIERTVR